mmetsp:Transcript_27323/g.45192  ORF Transcript_27323/g.45192 Transcript_27323/m.45192 type:complete len:234 (+) Transcript_27323:134-835(+)
MNSDYVPPLVPRIAVGMILLLGFCFETKRHLAQGWTQPYAPKSSSSFLGHPTAHRRRWLPSHLTSKATTKSIEFQADHGRGQDHLSAFLDEGDVVVYQTGTWYVDGVEVGDGSPTDFEWARIDTLQIVHTHNCEHGVIRGIAMKTPPQNILGDEDETNHNADDNGGVTSDGFVRLCAVEPMEVVEFGPEQLVARVPMIWENDDDNRGKTAVPLAIDDQNSLWMTATERTETEG